jgi:hypothetical protein
MRQAQAAPRYALGMRPWLLTDVDDVLVWHRNRPGKDSPPYCRHPEHRNLVRRTIGIRSGHVDLTAGTRLLRVAERTGAELGWGTGMGADGANMYIAPLLGLPQLPGVDMMRWPDPGEAPPDGVWKCLNLIRWLASPGGRPVRTEEMRPFAWLDNDPDIPAFLAGTHGLPPYKVVTVDPWTALTSEHLAEAEEWLLSLPNSKSRES